MKPPYTMTIDMSLYEQDADGEKSRRKAELAIRYYDLSYSRLLDIEKEFIAKPLTSLIETGEAEVATGKR